MQKRILLSLEKPVCKVDPWLASGNLNFRSVFAILISVSTDSVVYAEHLLYFWETEILAPVRQRIPAWPTPTKNPEHWVSDEFSWQLTHFICVITCVHSHVFILGEIKHILCDSTGRRKTLGNLHLVSSRLHPFSFAGFALYPFAVISHSCESNYILSPVNPPNKSSKCGWSWGPQHTLLYLFPTHSCFLSRNLIKVLCKGSVFNSFWCWDGNSTPFPCVQKFCSF